MIYHGVRAPSCKHSFPVEPGNEPAAEGSEPLDDSSIFPQLSGGGRLALISYIVEVMAAEQRLVKMANNRQEGVRQNREGLPWTIR